MKKNGIYLIESKDEIETKKWNKKQIVGRVVIVIDNKYCSFKFGIIPRFTCNIQTTLWIYRIFSLFFLLWYFLSQTKIMLEMPTIERMQKIHHINWCRVNCCCKFPFAYSMVYTVSGMHKYIACPLALVFVQCAHSWKKKWLAVMLAHAHHWWQKIHANEHRYASMKVKIENIYNVGNFFVYVCMCFWWLSLASMNFYFLGKIWPFKTKKKK